MENYKPLFIVTLAFTAAVWSYIYYADYQTVQAQQRVQAEREKQVQELKRQKLEVQALHILVKTFEEAQALRNELVAGEKFEKVAEFFSLCPSGQKGGELGYVRKGQMSPEFERAVFNLREGEISQPVKTEFGWHLIKVTDIVYVGDVYKQKK